MGRKILIAASIIVLLALSIAPEALPPVHASSTSPVSFSFQGTLISGTLTDNAIQVTSGSVSTDGVTYQFSTNTPPFTTPDLNQIHVSSSCGGLSTTNCLHATAIYLGNNIVMGWAAVYTVASSSSLSVTWGYTGPPAFPGSTAITLGFDGQLLASISATGVLSISGSQVAVSASGNALIVSPLPSTNLIVNPGFENGLNGWSVSTGTATYSVDSTTQISGCCSAKGVEVNTGSLGRLYQDVTTITSPGSQYQIGGWIKTSNVIGNVVIALDYVGTNPSYGWTPADGYVMEIGHVSGTQGWTFYQSPTFTLPLMPSDAVAAWFLFDFNAGAGTAWWDDVSLVCVSNCPTSRLAISTASLPNAELHAPYSTTLTASGGTPPYTWSVTTNNVALTSIGLSLSPSGVLSGIPANFGPISFVVQVQDNVRATASRELTLTITQGPLIVCTSALCALPTTDLGTQYSTILQVQGGVTPYSFSLVSGTLPPGLSLSASGTISGAATSPGLFDFAIRVSDSIGGYSIQILSLTVLPPSLNEACSGNKQFNPTVGPFTQEIPVGSAEIIASASGGLGISSNICITAQGFTLKSFSLNINVTTDASISLTTTGSLTYSNTLPLGRPIEVGVIDVGPVAILVQLAPELTVNAQASASVTVGIAQGSKLQLSVQCNSGSSTCSTSHTFSCTNGASSSPCIVPISSATFQGSLGARLDLGTSFLIYGLTGPTVTPSMTLELDGGASTSGTSGPSCNGLQEGTSPGSWWGLCAKATVGVGVDLSVLGYSSGQYSVASIDLGSLLIAASVAVSPSMTTARAGHSLSFAALVAGSSVPAGSSLASEISWNILQSNCGTLESSTGATTRYDTPPAVPTSGITCSLQATWTFIISSPPGTATITVLPSKP